jgi:hypothetical protein
MTKEELNPTHDIAEKTQMEIFDWLMTAEPVASISETEIVLETVSDIVKVVSKLYQERWQGQVVRGDWTVLLSNSGIRSSKAHSISKAMINAFAAVPNIIENGRVVEINRNWKGRSYDSYILIAPIKIGVIEYVADVIINHHKDGTYTFYLHEVEKKEKLQGAIHTSYDTRTPEASKFRITQLFEKVNKKL